MSISRTGATKALALNAAYDQCNSGKIKIYSGSVPANANSALSGNTLLAQPSYSSTAFAPAVASGNGATKTANAITPDTDAAATGTATFFRRTKSDGTVVSQNPIADLGLNTTAIVQHTTVSVSSDVITAGA